MNLTEKEMDELWGMEGPYSEAKLLIEQRILDDSISRTFLRVEANMNPFTYKIVKRDRNNFGEDEIIQQLVDEAHYCGPEYGYYFIYFEKAFVFNIENDAMKEAKEKLEEMSQTIIKMHKYTMEIMSNPN